MLTALRKGSKSKVMQILLGLIALSFVGFFGVSGSGGHGGGARNGANADGVAQVGNVDIGVAEFARAFNGEIQTLQQRLNTPISAVQAQQLGLLDVAMNRLVRGTLYNLGAADLGLAVTDDQVRGAIFTLPQFVNEDGQFDRDAFDLFLLRNGISEAQFVELLREDLRRQQFLGTIGAGGFAPEALVEALYDYRQERRVAEVIVVSDTDVADVGEPDGGAIDGYYQANLSQFMAPQYRAISVAVLTPEALASEVAVDEDDILAEYEFRRNSLTIAETRTIDQALFFDAASAQAAADRIAGGETFDAASEAVSGLAPAPLGAVVAADLPDELAGPAFALAEGGVSTPVESPLGWHLMHVTDVQERVVTPLAEVRDEIHAALAISIARDQIFEILNDLEDALAGGADLEGAARAANLRVERIAAVSAGGLDESGAPIDGVAGSNEVVTVAFEAQQGSDPTVVETAEGGFFALRVDRITAPAPRPLDEVRDRVVAGWQLQQRQEASQARAREIVDRISGGADIFDVAAEFDLPADEAGPFTRTGGGAELPGEFIAATFRGAVGDVSLTPAPGGFIVGRLIDILPPNPADDLTGFVGLQDNLDQLIAADLQVQLARALEGRFEVDVDQQALQDLVTSGGLGAAAAGGGLGGGHGG